MEYENQIRLEVKNWKKQLIRKKSIFERFSKQTQNKVNTFIPKKVHQFITESIKQMVEIAMTGSDYLPTKSYNSPLSMKEREEIIQDKLLKFKRMAALEGAGTGAGGIFLGLADFPLLLAIKMRFLFEVGNIYGFQTKEYRERLFILFVFQLAFSDDEQKEQLLEVIENWETESIHYHDLDWRKWQQEYRDYIDLVKLFQLIPGIGAVVGAYANYQLLEHLGETAIMCYRLRKLK